jgi:hypothetical protein
MMLMLVAVLAIVALAPMGMRGVSVGSNNSLAMGYAQLLMEQTCALPFSLQTVNTPPGPVAQQLTTQIIPSVTSGPGWTYQIGISYPKDTSGNVINYEMHQIEVTVFWFEDNPSGKQIQKSYRLVGYSAYTPQ